MGFFNRFFYGEHVTSRVWLLSRLFLATLALDIAVLMLRHAGRYGSAGYNVAHFAWLDSLIPLPTPALYSGVLSMAAILALVMFFTGVRAIPALLLFLLYTFGWSMSLLDTFQHHYFLSLALFCMIFFRADRLAVTTHKATDWGFSLLGATVSILYVYTAIAKLDAEWLSGATLQRIARNTAFADILALTQRISMPDQQAWSVAAVVTIAMEIVIGVAYLFAVIRDNSNTTSVRVVCMVGFITALLLHLGTAGMNLEIGLFAVYMLALAFCFFLPSIRTDFVRDAVMSVFFHIRAAIPPALTARRAVVLQKVLFAVVAVLLLLVLAPRFDLPGLRQACLLSAASVAVLALLSIFAPQKLESRWVSLGTAASIAIIFAAISSTTVRWDYYRYLGGDLRRRDEFDAALQAYEKSEIYAPRDSSRQEIIEELKRRVGR